jgi:hypothetical protein
MNEALVSKILYEGISFIYEQFQLDKKENNICEYIETIYNNSESVVTDSSNNDPTAEISSSNPPWGENDSTRNVVAITKYISSSKKGIPKKFWTNYKSFDICLAIIHICESMSPLCEWKPFMEKLRDLINEGDFKETCETNFFHKKVSILRATEVNRLLFIQKVSQYCNAIISLEEDENKKEMAKKLSNIFIEIFPLRDKSFKENEQLYLLCIAEIFLNPTLISDTTSNPDKVKKQRGLFFVLSKGTTKDKKDDKKDKKEKKEDKPLKKKEDKPKKEEKPKKEKKNEEKPKKEKKNKKNETPPKKDKKEKKKKHDKQDESTEPVVQEENEEEDNNEPTVVENEEEEPMANIGQEILNNLIESAIPSVPTDIPSIVSTISTLASAITDVHNHITNNDAIDVSEATQDNEGKISIDEQETKPEIIFSASEPVEPQIDEVQLKPLSQVGKSVFNCSTDHMSIDDLKNIGKYENLSFNKDSRDSFCEDDVNDANYKKMIDDITVAVIASVTKIISPMFDELKSLIANQKHANISDELKDESD